MYEWKGLHLRKTDAGDLSALLQFREEAWRSLHRPLVLNLSDQQKWLATVPYDVVPLTVERVGEATVVGFGQWCRICRINRSATGTWGLLSNYRGLKLGGPLVEAMTKFALDVLNLDRLDAEVLSFNQRGIEVIEAAGYAREGVRRGAVMRGGERCDSIVYGYLRGQ